VWRGVQNDFVASRAVIDVGVVPAFFRPSPDALELCCLEAFEAVPFLICEFGAQCCRAFSFSDSDDLLVGPLGPADDLLVGPLGSKRKYGCSPLSAEY
jgi:hypothetical protein